MPAHSKPYFSTSLEKGLRILSLFNRDRKSITQSEVSRLLGMNMTSTYRYINTFVTLGYLKKDSNTKRLQPGIRCLSLFNNLMQATNKLDLIRGEVDRLYEEHNITVDVALVNEETLISVYRRRAEDTLTYHLQTVAANCLHNTSTGKSYLSALSAEDLEETVNRIPLTQKTQHTVTERWRLLEEIELTRKRGYAVSVEEYLPGLITIGAPLINTTTGSCLGAVSFDFSVIQTGHEEVEHRYAGLIIEFSGMLSEVLSD